MEEYIQKQQLLKELAGAEETREILPGRKLERKFKPSKIVHELTIAAAAILLFFSLGVFWVNYLSSETLRGAVLESISQKLFSWFDNLAELAYEKILGYRGRG